MKLKIRKERVFIALTLLRIVLAFVVGILVLYRNFSGKLNIALVFFIVTALIAFFEGLVAKKLIERSLLRSILDFAADKLLVNFVAITLVMKSLLPFWVMLVFLIRDLATVIIGLIMFYRDFRREFKPTALGKISLFFQIIALIPAIMGNADWVLIGIAIALTFASGVLALFKSEFRLVKKKKDFDEFRIFRLMKLADVFTLTNVIFGIISILFSIEGRFVTASIMLILAVVSDFFDGKLAKVMGQQNEFGKELDSLADTVSFGVAPAVFGFSLIQTPIAVICFTIFLFCGILRLARYNIMNLKGSFQGMPITMNGILIPFAFLFRNFFHIETKFFPYIYLALGILMVSSFRIKKIS